MQGFHQRLGVGAVLVFLALVSYIVGKSLYNIFFHPLRSYPGPKWWSASRLPWLQHSIAGDLHRVIPKLHEKYGAVVRIAPDELSYTSPEAWKEIYGHRTPEMEKNLKGAGLMPPHRGARSIITADREDHARMRRTIAHAFSEKALREQESFLQEYVDTLIVRLKEHAPLGPQDLVAWFNWTTFDVIGDLSFGEPFGCLKDTNYHPWVSSVFEGVKLIPYIQACLYFNAMSLLQYLAPRSMVEAKAKNDQNADEKVDRRVARKDLERKDFLSYILRHNDEKGLSLAEIKETAGILIIAGSETTATFLSGAVYYILRNSRVRQRLTREVRDRFPSESDITMQSVQDLKYMAAVIEEAFRIYPPAPSTFPRVVPGKGENLAGEWVPGGTTVGVHQYAANHDPRNFHRPEDFLPERYLSESMLTEGDEKAHSFKNDNKGVVQPFSFGPRNCIGKSLAYAELRLILAKLVWTFDMELAPESDNARWVLDQKTALIWEKLPLFTKLTQVQGEKVPATIGK